MLQRDARLEPRHNIGVVPGQVRAHPGREGRRHPEADIARRHEIEAPRHHADDLVRLVVQRNLASDDARRSAKAALPEAVADHHDTHTLVVLICGEHAAQHGMHTQHAPEGPRHFSPRDLFGFAVAGQCRVSGLSACEVGEYGIETAPFDPLRRRGVVPRQDIGLAHKVPDHYQPIRIGVRERSDQHGVEDAEYGGNSADAQRQTQNRRSRELRAIPQKTHAVPAVAEEVREPADGALIAHGFGCLRVRPPPRPFSRWKRSS